MPDRFQKLHSNLRMLADKIIQDHSIHFFALRTEQLAIFVPINLCRFNPVDVIVRNIRLLKRFPLKFLSIILYSIWIIRFPVAKHHEPFLICSVCRRLSARSFELLSDHARRGRFVKLRAQTKNLVNVRLF